MILGIFYAKNFPLLQIPWKKQMDMMVLLVILLVVVLVVLGVVICIVRNGKQNVAVSLWECLDSK